MQSTNLYLTQQYRKQTSNVFTNLVKGQFSSIDLAILVAAVTLTMVGLVIVYSITMPYGNFYLKQQVIRIFIGLISLITAINIPYTCYKGKFKDVLLIITIVLLIITLVIGKQVAEAKRWAYFFQPAEIAKFTLLIWLSGYFANRKEGIAIPEQKNRLKMNNFPYLPLVTVCLVIGLLLLQPAIGTSVILTLSSLLLFFISGIKFRHLLLITIIGSILIIATIFTVPYAKKRFYDFRSGITYQQKQSKIAIGSGRLFGKGLGEGKQKFYFLPKLHTDFIFSAIAEEFGFIGSIFIIFLFFIIFSRGLNIVLSIQDTFGQLLSISILFIIIQYLIIHLGVALSLFPTTGQPLPFISYGGSALATNLYAIGILLNISKFRRQKSESNFNRNRWNRRSYLPGHRSR